MADRTFKRLKCLIGLKAPPGVGRALRQALCARPPFGHSLARTADRRVRGLSPQRRLALAAASQSHTSASHHATALARRFERGERQAPPTSPRTAATTACITENGPLILAPMGLRPGHWAANLMDETQGVEVSKECLKTSWLYALKKRSTSPSLSLRRTRSTAACSAKKFAADSLGGHW